MFPFVNPFMFRTFWPSNFDKLPKHRYIYTGWWYIRQLGWWHSQYMESHKSHVSNQLYIYIFIYLQLYYNIIYIYTKTHTHIYIYIYRMEWTADGLGWARLKDPSEKKLGARWGSYAITSQETNIAMGNGTFIEVYLLKMVIFHGYVKLPDGTEYISGWWCNNHLEKYEFVNGKDDIPYIYIYYGK